MTINASDNPENPVQLVFFLPRSISWTLFKRAEACEHQAEFHRRKEPKQNTGWPSYYADVGTAVQRIFELFFNQGVNLREGGASPANVALCAEKVLTQDPFLREVFDKTTFPKGKDRLAMFQQVRADVKTGLHAIHAAGFLDKRVRCEVKGEGKIGAWPVFGLVDFLVQNGDGTEEVWDGKAVSQANADQDQVRFYAAVRAFNGARIRGGGIVYFRQGRAVPVDLGKEAMTKFLARFAKTDHVWEAMKGGAFGLPATSKSTHDCHWCPWVDRCEASLKAQKLPADLDGPAEIDFEDL